MELFKLLAVLDDTSSSASEGGFIDQLKEELGSISNKLIPNFFSLLVQILALVVMIVVVMVVLYKPIKKTLAARATFVENEMNSAKENNVISEQNRVLSEQEIIDSRKRANEIIAAANASAEAQRAQAIEETNAMILKMKEDAEKEILKAKEEAQIEIQNEILNVALDASKEILKREINEEDDSLLVKEFIKDVK